MIHEHRTPRLLIVAPVTAVNSSGESVGILTTFAKGLFPLNCSLKSSSAIFAPSPAVSAWLRISIPCIFSSRSIPTIITISPPYPEVTTFMQKPTLSSPFFARVTSSLSCAKLSAWGRIFFIASSEALFSDLSIAGAVILLTLARSAATTAQIRRSLIVRVDISFII